MALWLLIDGNNLAYRAFYGMPELARKDGFPTGALHGWVRMLWMLQDQEKPGHITVFFDLGASTRHEKLLADYKAQRKEMPQPLFQQLEPMKRITRALGITVVERQGVEADDLLASAAVQLAAKGNDVLMVSADKDFGQLVGGRILQLVPPPTANPKLGWRRLDEAGVKEKFGVRPALIPALLALTGDASDNIPGLDGVGYKTAAKWLDEFGDLETLQRRWDWVKPDRFRPQLKEAGPLLKRNLELVTLQAELDPGPLEPPAPDPAAAIAFFEEMEMRRSLEDAKKRLG
ncbi:MAG TPA: 5'-3' exonuclease H3TH domain-containing protein [Verrucomicrobiae bacterium]|nr:5'-3' exonuclease H3TH domain-containing protein [Verrucomicrobiae bacterium]